ncbi:MAG: hypothetical protein ACE5EG_10085 [Thermoanaerobaculia bacterium]
MARDRGFRGALVARLKYLIELRGKSVAQVEKELGRSRGFLGDALRGGKRLPLETILEVLALLRVDPAKFFAGAAPEERRWGAYPVAGSAASEAAEGEAEDPLRRILDNLGDGSIEIEEVARALRAVVRLLDEKGYLSREELGSALAANADSGKRS